MEEQQQEKQEEVTQQQQQQHQQEAPSRPPIEELVQQLRDITGQDAAACRALLDAHDGDLNAALLTHLAIAHSTSDDDDDEEEDGNNNIGGDLLQGQQTDYFGATTTAAIGATAGAAAGRRQEEEEDEFDEDEAAAIAASLEPPRERAASANDATSSTAATATTTTAAAAIGAAASGASAQIVPPVSAAAAASAAASASLSASAASSMNLGNILGMLLHPLRVLAGGSVPTGNQRLDARRFAESFERRYGHSDDGAHVDFVESSFRDALLQSTRERKMVLIYLHCGEHPDSDLFCREVLASQEVNNLINESMVVWGGDIDQPDAYQAAISFQVATYPFIALVKVTGTGQRITSAKLIERIEGREPVQSVLFKLRQAVQRYQHDFDGETRARREALERTSILKEQERELKRAMEDDRRREEEEARLAEELRKQQEEEEKRIKMEEERVERERLAFLERIEAKRQGLLPEPPESEKGTYTIRFQLPEGTKISATLKDVRDYLDVELFDRKSTVKNFALSLSFPKKTFHADEGNLTLSEAGLALRSALFVQNLDA